MGQTQDAVLGRAATLRLSLLSSFHPQRKAVKRSAQRQRPAARTTSDGRTTVDEGRVPALRLSYYFKFGVAGRRER